MKRFIAHWARYKNTHHLDLSGFKAEGEDINDGTVSKLFGCIARLNLYDGVKIGKDDRFEDSDDSDEYVVLKRLFSTTNFQQLLI
ncbi:hypothetical protein L596_023745 [Steinernema carpocapsae]|uniref:Uncharacterized protein n=1 Tax=Steinernema carpocapsae TaxID=34508 RepID=A0A4U5MET8_STECR|nr:hypothetical protein L596_023745 [Steinernema carpocapsae]